MIWGGIFPPLFLVQHPSMSGWVPGGPRSLLPVWSGQVASLRQKSGDVLALETTDHKGQEFFRFLKDSIEAHVPRIYDVDRTLYVYIYMIIYLYHYTYWFIMHIYYVACVYVTIYHV